MAGHVSFRWLSREPPIVRYVSPIWDEEATQLRFYRAFPPGRVYHLVAYYWHCTGEQIERHHRLVQSLRPDDVVHHLVNERDVLADLRSRGVAASLVSTNAFLDERLIALDPSAAKRFDAVYTARMNPFKRHSLARKVDSLLLIGGMQGMGDSRAYLTSLRRELPHAAFAHRPGRGYLPVETVVRLVNSARVGLCLSSAEGAMYAAAEYLLCGLPVVSTRAVGGREEWLDHPFARLVADDRAEIAAAVAELVELRPPADEIRHEALRTLREHRRRFVDVGQQILDGESSGRDFAREWYSGFFHKLECWRPAEQVIEHLRSDCPPAGAAVPSPQLTTRARALFTRAPRVKERAR